MNVDDLKERMERYPEINRSEVTRQAIQRKVKQLELLDELTEDSEITEYGVKELAERIDGCTQ